jgi:hypothetical protein
MRYGGLAVAASSSKLCLRAGSGKKKRRKGEVGWAKENGPHEQEMKLGRAKKKKKTMACAGKNQRAGLM